MNRKSKEMKLKKVKTLDELDDDEESSSNSSGDFVMHDETHRKTSVYKDRMINLKPEQWEKSEFYELDQTVDLVQNFHLQQNNGCTIIRHSVNYEKNN